MNPEERSPHPKSIDIAERYRLILAEHQFASSFRTRIVGILGVSYFALAAAFAWLYKEFWQISFFIPLFGAGVTYFTLIADRRNRQVIHISAKIGKIIEQAEEAGIPANQRYFAALETEGRRKAARWVQFFAKGRRSKAEYESHSLAIDALSHIAIIIFLVVFTSLILQIFAFIVKDCLLRQS
jgi:hypothetical protein